MLYRLIFQNMEIKIDERKEELIPLMDKATEFLRWLVILLLVLAILLS